MRGSLGGTALGVFVLGANAALLGPFNPAWAQNSNALLQGERINQ